MDKWLTERVKRFFRVVGQKIVKMAVRCTRLLAQLDTGITSLLLIAIVMLGFRYRVEVLTILPDIINSLYAVYMVFFCYIVVIFLARMIYPHSRTITPTGNMLAAAAYGRALTEDDRMRVAVHEAGHLLAYAVFKSVPEIFTVWVGEKDIPGSPRGHVNFEYSGSTDDRQFMYDRMCVNLAGAVSERLIYGSEHNGCQGDSEGWEDNARVYLNGYSILSDLIWYSKPRSRFEADANSDTLLALRKPQVDRMAALLESNIKLIEEIAEKLIEAGDLSNDEAQAYVSRVNVPELKFEQLI